MSPLFVYYPKCGTCRKASKWLEENGIEVEKRHIIENPPTREELEKWFAANQNCWIFLPQTECWLNGRFWLRKKDASSSGSMKQNGGKQSAPELPISHGKLTHSDTANVREHQ